MKKNKILVTGGTGFFGCSLLDMIAAGNWRDCRFILLSRRAESFALSHPEYTALENVEFISGDVRALNKLDAGFDYIIHAATPAVDTPDDAELRDIIIAGTESVLAFAKRCNVKKLLNEASLNIGNEIYMDDTDDDNYRVFKMEPVYDKESLVTLGSKVDVWYKSAEKFDFDSYGRELFIKDSVLTVMKKKKLSEDTIKYVTDSFDYIITHRLFLFDSISREYDKNITLDIDFFEYIYRDDSLSIDSLYKIMESRTDTTYYYEN